MKSDIEILNGYFISQMMAELGKIGPVYSSLPSIKNIKLLNYCVIPFGFRKGMTENFCYQVRAISSFLINTRDKKNPICFYC